jgi:hypothetical protein
MPRAFCRSLSLSRPLVLSNRRILFKISSSDQRFGTGRPACARSNVFASTIGGNASCFLTQSRGSTGISGPLRRCECRFQMLQPMYFGFLTTLWTPTCVHGLPSWVMPLRFSSRAIALGPLPSAAIKNIFRTLSSSLRGPGTRITRSVVRLFCSPGFITCLGLPSAETMSRR